MKKPKSKTATDPITQAAPDFTCLSGKFFHSIGKDTGKIEWQGQVIGTPEPGWYLVQLFEWMMGEPNVMRLVPFEDMVHWLFYEDSATMIHSYDEGIAREGGKYRDRHV